MLHADSTLETTWHCVTFGHARCGSLTVRKVKRNIYICYKLNEEERVHDGVQSPLFVWKDQQSNTTGCNINIYAEELQLTLESGGKAWMQFCCCRCCSYWCIRGQLPRIDRQPFFFLTLFTPTPTHCCDIHENCVCFLIRKFSPKWFWSCTWVNWTWSQNLYNTIV